MILIVLKSWSGHDKMKDGRTAGKDKVATTFNRNWGAYKVIFKLDKGTVFFLNIDLLNFQCKRIVKMVDKHLHLREIGSRY